MKKYPKTCTNCKFAYGCGYTKVSHGNFTYRVKKCIFTNQPLKGDSATMVTKLEIQKYE